MKKKQVLVLGAGLDRQQRVVLGASNGPTFADNFEQVHTLDISAAVKPTICKDMSVPGWGLEYSRAFGPADEVHAYECLHLVGRPEYYGQAGSFFRLWRDIWHATKPGGLVAVTTPWWESKWVFQDPGVVQVYTPEKLWYLDASHSERPMMTNYDYLWPAPYTFTIGYASQRGEDPKNSGFTFIIVKGERESSEG